MWTVLNDAKKMNCEEFSNNDNTDDYTEQDSEYIDHKIKGIFYFYVQYSKCSNLNWLEELL